ncbi:MAG: CotH kinase family protein [Candidatus Promineifilaceae bacterium]|nr:CotH kinase family protein [Candidatus Promineifilaceae bacterium]
MSINGMISSYNDKLSSRLKRISRPFRGIWPRTSDALIGMFALLIIVLALLTYFKPVVMWASQVVSGNKYIVALDGFFNPFRNSNLLLSGDLPVYDLDISSEQMDIIDATIEDALKQGWMSDEMKVWANATFYYDGQKYDAEVRVRGDLPPHWENPKKSWRIKFTKQNVEHNGETVNEPIYLDGKRQINLIIPNDRDYVVAPFVNQLMREEGLVVPRDKYVVLRINGVVQGLYYEVEHFDKPLLAASERPETTVFGQNDRAMHFEQYTKYGTPIVSDAKYDIGTRRLQVDEVGESPMLGMRTMEVLLDHSQNPSPASFEHVRSVMDWDKYLSFRNLTTLFNTNHVRFGSDNLKLYFDPSTGLLEPIPWDVHIVRMPPEPGTIDFWNSHGMDEIQRSTLLNPETRLERNRKLWEWIEDGGDEIIDKFDAWHEKLRPLVWVDMLKTPWQVDKMDQIRSDFVYNVRRVHKVMSLSSANFNYRLEAPDRASMEAVALNFGGIVLEGITLTDPKFEGIYQLYEDINENSELDEQDILITEVQAENGRVYFDIDKFVPPELVYDADTIDGRYWEYFDTRAGRTRYFVTGKLDEEIRHPLEWSPPAIQVDAFNAVTDEDMSTSFINFSEPVSEEYIGITAYDASDVFDLDAPKMSQRAFLDAHPEFQASASQPGAVELAGNVQISNTVIVPESVPLIIQPGTDITMAPGASVLAFGGLTAVGTADQRIKIHGEASPDPKQPDGAWGTFAAVRSDQEVVLEYIDISGGGQAQINGLFFSGGVAVYNSDLRVTNCSIVDMYSEDGLNLKNGQVFIDNCLFARNASDSVDIDFGTGEVRNSHFLDNINDGLDISGSELEIANNRFEYNGDKGLSVGEQSYPTINNSLFRANQIGMAVKDLSHAKIAYSTFIKNVIALEVNRKKPFFGGGSAEVVNSVFIGNETLLDEDYFSAGQTEFRSTLADDQTACPECIPGIARFREADIAVRSGTGDYRLLDNVLNSSEFEAVQADWIHSADAEGAPSLPGVFSELR